MALVGNLLGMWITRRHNINTKQTIGIIIFSLFMTLVMIIVLFFIGGVENDDIIGIPPSEFRYSLSNLNLRTGEKFLDCVIIFK